MTTTTTTYARFWHSPVQHILVPGTKTTRCGKDATLAYKYGPFPGNINRDCTKCRKD